MGPFGCPDMKCKKEHLMMFGEKYNVDFYSHDKLALWDNHTLKTVSKYFRGRNVQL